MVDRGTGPHRHHGQRKLRHREEISREPRPNGLAASADKEMFKGGSHMKLWFVFAQSGVSGVIHVDPEKVAAALAKGGSLVTAPDLLVSGSHREAAGQVEVHDKETDVLYILDGEATFVTGGQM